MSCYYYVVRLWVTCTHDRRMKKDTPSHNKEIWIEQHQTQMNNQPIINRQIVIPCKTRRKQITFIIWTIVYGRLFVPFHFGIFHGVSRIDLNFVGRVDYFNASESENKTQTQNERMKNAQVNSMGDGMSNENVSGRIENKIKLNFMRACNWIIVKPWWNFIKMHRQFDTLGVYLCILWFDSVYAYTNGARRTSHSTSYTDIHLTNNCSQRWTYNYHWHYGHKVPHR